MAATRTLEITLDLKDPKTQLRQLETIVDRITSKVDRLKGAIVASPGDVVVLTVKGMAPDHMASIQAQWSQFAPDVRLALIDAELTDASLPAP
jgi:hypothetical protein